MGAELSERPRSTPQVETMLRTPISVTEEHSLASSRSVGRCS